MIVALAGRRIDVVDCKHSRFPLKNAAKVQERIRAKLIEHQATTLICSGACGADLLALEAARAIENMRLRLVLPFEPERFRQTSVIDRPGNWGAIFDRVLLEIEAAGDLVILSLRDKSYSAYTATNQAIIEEALAIAQLTTGDCKATRNEKGSDKVIALVVWDKISHGNYDVTAHFKDEALKCGLSVEEIATQ